MHESIELVVNGLSYNVLSPAWTYLENDDHFVQAKKYWNVK